MHIPASKVPGFKAGKGLKDKAVRGLQSLFTKPGVSKKQIEAFDKDGISIPYPHTVEIKRDA